MSGPMNPTDAANVIAHLTRTVALAHADDPGRPAVERVIAHLSNEIERLNAPSDNGGPAFPVLFQVDRNDNVLTYAAEGMTLRDYFIAHAPAEPQPWFSPSMPPAPVLPAFHQAPEAVRQELQHSDYEEWCNPKDMSDVARAWHEQRDAARRAGNVWRAEAEKQRYVQWPAAWADEQLKARAS